MARYRYTAYFENEVLRKRPYLQRAWCEYVIERAEKVEPQEQIFFLFWRIRFWARVPALNSRYLRVITLADGVTIHNAFPDRGFKK